MARNIFENIISGTRFGQRQEQSRQRDLQNDMKVVAAIQDPAEKQAAMSQMMDKHPGLLQLQDKMSKASFASQKVKSEIDPSVKRAEDIGKMSEARANVDPENEDLMSFFDQNLADYQQRNPVPGGPSKAPGGNVQGQGDVAPANNADFFADTPRAHKTTDGGKGGPPVKVPPGTSILPKDSPLQSVFKTAREGLVDVRDAFSGGVDPFKDESGATGGKAPVKDKDEFIQRATELSPTQNVPKTFEELGIQDADSQAAFQEMNSATDDVFRSNYEQDPENGQRVIKAWKAGKITKEQLKELMSKAAIQQDARQSLGTA